MIGYYLPGGPQPVPFMASYVVGSTLTDPTVPPTITLYPPTGGGDPFTLTLTNDTVGVWKLDWVPPSNAALGSWGVIYNAAQFGSVYGDPSPLETFVITATITMTVGQDDLYYCTTSDIQCRYPFLSALTDDQCAFLIQLAQSDIDSKVASKYSVPFAIPCPAFIRTCCIVLAAWNGIDSKLSKDKLDKVAPGLERAYKTVTKWLDEIRDGNRLLPEVPAYAQLQSSTYSQDPYAPNPQRFNLYSDPFLSGYSRLPNWAQFSDLFPGGSGEI